MTDQVFVFSDLRLTSILFFTFGLLCQSLFLIRHHLHKKETLKTIFACLLGSLIFSGLITFFSFFSEVSNGDFDFYQFIFLNCIAYALAFSFMFKNNLLPVIKEQTILVHFTVLFYLLFFTLNPETKIVMLTVFLLPSLAIIILLLLPMKFGFTGKLLFYSYYLLLTIILLMFQFSFGNLTFFFNSINFTEFNNIDLFITGMMFMYLLTHTLYLYELINPIRQDNSFQKWKEHISILVSKYTNIQLSPIAGILIIIVVGGSLILNHRNNIVPNYLLINVFLVLDSLFTTIKN